MLKFSNSQLEALASHQHRAFVKQQVARISAQTQPGSEAERKEQQDRVSDALTRARRWGFETRQALAAFVDLDTALPGFDGIDWVRKILDRRDLSETMRCNKIRRRLAEGSGSHGHH